MYSDTLLRSTMCASIASIPFHACGFRNHADGVWCPWIYTLVVSSGLAGAKVFRKWSFMSAASDGKINIVTSDRTQVERGNKQDYALEAIVLTTVST